MKKIIQNKLAGIGLLIFMFVISPGIAKAVVCDINKPNGIGFSTSIHSVVCNNNNTYTIVLWIINDGCHESSCKELSHLSVEADAGTYSNISVQHISGGMTYSGIDDGPHLGGDPFDGFKVEGIHGIGEGHAGTFAITYTLTSLQAQQVLAKAGNAHYIASFTIADFTSVMNCNHTGCGPVIVGPIAVDDIATTPMNIPVNISILTNDIPGSGALVPSSVTWVSGTAPLALVGVFTVNNAGVVTFTPAFNYTGIATIKYKVCDVNALCAVATITVTITPPGTDTDDDGCPDDVDDYPNDPTRCFDNYFPATGNGTLAYEDLWPGQGDYDFNDLVCDYRFKTVTNHNNKVVEIFGSFTIKAFGASFHNGFGFQLPNNNVNPAMLTVTGYDLREQYITLNSNGLEQGQSKPTIIVYDDAYNLMPNPGQGIGVNTTPGAPYVTPVMITVHLAFSSPIYTMGEINIGNFNPFIIVDKTRGIEVHLPDYLPTSLANTGYFGQAQDDSKPITGKYYKTVNNLPWAINIYESFAYPIEKVEILNTYNHFVQWAVSGGSLYPDWYKNLPGYRNNSNIY
ncbi:MAG: LruC domain-containing protein [Bacteroidota bacterium]